MSILYCTADAIGAPSGGGRVTKEELTALQEFSSERLLSTRDVSFASVMVLGRDQLGSQGEEPWKWDNRACEILSGNRTIKLAHFYSGTFPKTVALLKENGCKISYTIAAHDRFVSRREHEKVGAPFPYPHLTDERIWRRYIEGYRLADVIITPGNVPAETIRKYGEDFSSKPLLVVPHGCDLPEEVAPFPSNFCVGYMGSWGMDKGVRYLLEAWKKLDYRDGSMLVLAGRDSVSPAWKPFLEKFGSGCISLRGWVNNISDFYNSISLYVQPSATEGFGIEVVEALAHGRPVLCSEGAGAVDLCPPVSRFPACDADVLAHKIHEAKRELQAKAALVQPESYRSMALPYTWDKIRSGYQQVWRDLLGGKIK